MKTRRFFKRLGMVLAGLLILLCLVYLCLWSLPEMTTLQLSILSVF